MAGWPAFLGPPRGTRRAIGSRSPRPSPEPRRCTARSWRRGLLARRARGEILSVQYPHATSEGFVVQVSGFTIVRNAIKLDFPVEASIRSLLPVCDEVVVNVGRSDDATLDLVRSIADPKIRILESAWDMSRGNTVLGIETHRA